MSTDPQPEARRRPHSFSSAPSVFFDHPLVQETRTHLASQPTALSSKLSRLVTALTERSARLCWVAPQAVATTPGTAISASNYTYGYIQSTTEDTVMIEALAHLCSTVIATVEGQLYARFYQQHPEITYRHPLTPRERQIITLVWAGWTVDVIAAHYVISRRTVTTYNSKIYEKLGVHGLIEALIAARNLGLFYYLRNT